jgi:hypothetical protein
MTAQLVNWPGADGLTYMDTHEGGLYAMLLVLADDEEDDPQCHIDVSVLLTTPDARVSNCGDLWEPYNQQAARSRAEAEEILRKSGNQDAYTWAVRSFSDTALSVPVLAAIHIGSTSAALFRVHGGGFEVTYDDLTFRGKLLYDTLKTAYGREPKLLTFLDT